MIEVEQIPPGANILDVGCGPGELLLSLTRRGYVARGIDISAGMVATARSLLSAQDPALANRVSVGDIENLDFDAGSFDVVVASGVIEYQKDDAASLAEMRRVLRDGGYLILNVTNRYALLNAVDGGYRWLKKHQASHQVLDFLKSRVLGRGKLNPVPDRRTHSPWRFRSVLVASGFRPVRHNYFHFSPVPTPLDSVLPGLFGPFGQRMEVLTRSPIAPLLGGGYLVMARKGR
jgi:ubiquinone/menaquinone biosynthesis C-methylase UbiE